MKIQPGNYLYSTILKILEKIKICIFILLSMISFTNINIKAQEQTEDFVIPSVNTPPVIDGILDDPCWKEAIKLSLDYQIWPGNNVAPSDKTFTYLAYDSDHIYIAFQVYDSEPDKIRANLTRRDDIFSDDYVSIYFDTFYDKRTYYEFSFNPLGIQADAENGNFEWDTQFTSQGVLTKDGYTIEVSLPFSSIRFPDINFDTPWGLHIERYIIRKSEKISWMKVSPDINWQLQEGKFHGFKDVNVGHPVQIIPVLVTSSTGGRDDQDNFVTEPLDFKPGLNLKVGLTSELTFDSTLNPDFSQVEADAPQVDVNLRFPLYFSEKRPFFMEGQSIFSTPLKIVHTRTIVNPVFGEKLTGKIGDNTLGLIVSSDSAPGDLPDPNDPIYGQNALFTIFRYKRNILNDSEIGVIFTDRELSNSFNRVYGVDGTLNFGKYSLNFQGVNSDTQNEDRSTKSGGAYTARLNYGGRNLYFGLTNTYIDPDFNAEAGFIYRQGYRSYNAFLGYDFVAENEKEFLRSWGPLISASAYYYNDKLDEWNIGNSWDFNLSNQTYLGTYLNFSYLRYKGVDFNTSFTSIYIDNSYSKNFSGGFEFYFGDEVDYDRLILGKMWSYGLYGDIRIGESFKNSISISKNKLTDPSTEETLYDITTLRNTLTYQFTESLAFRTIFDLNTNGNRVGTNLLFTWTPNPGTCFFVGYDSQYSENELGVYRKNSNMFFMKMSYLFDFTID